MAQPAGCSWVWEQNQGTFGYPLIHTAPWEAKASHLARRRSPHTICQPELIA